MVVLLLVGVVGALDIALLRGVARAGEGLGPSSGRVMPIWQTLRSGDPPGAPSAARRAVNHSVTHRSPKRGVGGRELSTQHQRGHHKSCPGARHFAVFDGENDAATGAEE